MTNYHIDLGVYVEHTEPAFNRESAGIITQVFGTWFSYSTNEFAQLPNGKQADTYWRGNCMNYEDWKPMSRKPYTGAIKPSTVWRSHESRTCIVVGAAEKIRFIPIGSEGPVDVMSVNEPQFREWYLTPIDYDVSHAARLYVEFTRTMGATESAIKALSKLTTITPEEIEVAKTKAAASAKKPAAKKAANPGKKAPTKAAAASRGGGRKPSAASRFRELIMTETKTGSGNAKYTDDEIFTMVQKEFGVDEKRRSTYVSWYRYDLTRKGETPPEPKGGTEKRGRGRPAAKKTAAKKAPAKKTAAKKAPAKKPAAKKPAAKKKAPAKKK